jgi:hypothetical protein
LVSRYLLALFVCDWLSTIERLHEWCCNTTDWVSKTGYTPLFELSAARKVGSLFPVSLGDYVRVVGEALLLSFD